MEGGGFERLVPNAPTRVQEDEERDAAARRQRHQWEKRIAEIEDGGWERLAPVPDPPARVLKTPARVPDAPASVPKTTTRALKTTTRAPKTPLDRPYDSQQTPRHSKRLLAKIQNDSPPEDSVPAPDKIQDDSFPDANIPAPNIPRQFVSLREAIFGELDWNSGGRPLITYSRKPSSRKRRPRPTLTRPRPTPTKTRSPAAVMDRPSNGHVLRSIEDQLTFTGLSEGPLPETAKELSPTLVDMHKVPTLPQGGLEALLDGTPGARSAKTARGEVIEVSSAEESSGYYSSSEDEVDKETGAGAKKGVAVVKDLAMLVVNEEPQCTIEDREMSGSASETGADVQEGAAIAKDLAMPAIDEEPQYAIVDPASIEDGETAGSVEAPGINLLRPRAGVELFS